MQAVWVGASKRCELVVELYVAECVWAEGCRANVLLLLFYPVCSAPPSPPPTHKLTPRTRLSSARQELPPQLPSRHRHKSTNTCTPVPAPMSPPPPTHQPTHLGSARQEGGDVLLFQPALRGAELGPVAVDGQVAGGHHHRAVVLIPCCGRAGERASERVSELCKCSRKPACPVRGRGFPGGKHPCTGLLPKQLPNEDDESGGRFRGGEGALCRALCRRA